MDNDSVRDSFVRVKNQGKAIVLMPFFLVLLFFLDGNGESRERRSKLPKILGRVVFRAPVYRPTGVDTYRANEALRDLELRRLKMTRKLPR